MLNSRNIFLSLRSRTGTRPPTIVIKSLSFVTVQVNKNLKSSSNIYFKVVFHSMYIYGTAAAGEIICSFNVFLAQASCVGHVCLGAPCGQRSVTAAWATRSPWSILGQKNLGIKKIWVGNLVLPNSILVL